MKAKPLYSYSAGVLIGAEGDDVVASPARLRIDDFSANVAEADVSALAAKGANLILFCVALDAIAADPDSFNEAALARLREILKKAEEARIAAVLSIGDERDAAAPDMRDYLAGASEHAARRLKDCASLMGFAAPQWADEAFLLELEARLKKRRPDLLIFIPPRGSADGQAQGARGAELHRPPFVSPEFYPEGWL